MNSDLLSDVLRSVRLRGALYFHVCATQDWAAEAPPSREIAAAVMPGAERAIEFHAILSGECWGAVVGEQAVRLRAGDLVLFPHGDPHVISSEPGMRAPADPAGYFARQSQPRPFFLHLNARHAGADAGAPADPAATTLICGFVGCDLHPFNPLIESLPRLLHVHSGFDRDWAVQCMRQAAVEASGGQPGTGAMLERLSEMLFIDAIRQYLGLLPEGSQGWLAGVRDRFVGRALRLMHSSPGDPWTVGDLGLQVGLSRSAFHQRFLAMMGQTPMQYLAHWRMQAAAAMLRDTTATVATVAQEVGYETEATFSRAFKRVVGESPATWRRKRIAATTVADVGR
jgi:AraC-like DNA-binding protein